MFWDFISLRPETTYQVMLRFTDGGIPDGFRFMNGHGINTFKLVNIKGEVFWCKFHYLVSRKCRRRSMRAYFVSAYLEN